MEILSSVTMGITLKGKTLFSEEANYFPLRVDPIFFLVFKQFKYRERG